MEDGWLILNYLMFRERLSTDSQSVKTRERVKKHRDRYRALRNVTSVTSDHSASASASVQSVGVESEGGSFKSKRRFPTLEEVKLGCAKTGVPESDAIWFWNKCEGNGWTNGGKPIKSWAHTIASWKAAGYLPSQKGATGGNGTPQATVPIWRQAQAIAEQIEKHPANKDSVFHNPNATQEQKSELSKLRARLESLNRGITGV